MRASHDRCILYLAALLTACMQPSSRERAVSIGRSSSDGNTVVTVTTTFQHPFCEATRTTIDGTPLISVGFGTPSDAGIFFAVDPPSLGWPRRTERFEEPVIGDDGLWTSGVSFEEAANVELRSFSLPLAELAAVDESFGAPRGDVGVLGFASIAGDGAPSCSHGRAFTAAVRRSNVNAADPTQLEPGIASIAAVSFAPSQDGRTLLWWSGANQGVEPTRSGLNTFNELSFGPLTHPDGEAWVEATNVGFTALAARTFGIEGIADPAAPEDESSAVVMVDGFVEYTDGIEVRGFSKSIWCYVVEQTRVTQCAIE